MKDGGERERPMSLSSLEFSDIAETVSIDRPVIIPSFLCL